MTTSSLTTVEGFRLAYRGSLQGQSHKPLIVCLPGGTYNSAYFDVPGYSVLDAAAAAGYSVISFDRPNYGGSDSLDAASTTFAENARILSAGIDEIWSEVAESAAGVVIFGHSMGGAIGVHIAAAADSSRSWPLLGLSFSGANQKSPDHVVSAWKSAPVGAPVELSSEQRRMFMYGPDGSFDPAVLSEAQAACEASPLPELLEVVGGWLADYPALAPNVRVPVHYTLAEHDQLWLCSQERVDSFVAAMTKAPFVDSFFWPGAGHNIEHHYAAAEFIKSQLDFVLRCSEHAKA